jgi:hypothetical protein
VGGDGSGVVTHSIRLYERRRQERSDRHFCLAGRTKGIDGLEGFQAAPARPCGRSRMKTKTLQRTFLGK